MNDRSYVLTEYIPKAVLFLFDSDAESEDRYDEKMAVSDSIYRTLEYLEGNPDLTIVIKGVSLRPIDYWHNLRRDSFQDGWEFFWRLMFNYVKVPLPASTVARLRQCDDESLDEWGLPR